MSTTRIDAKINEARKQLDRATLQRDAAISSLIKSADKIKRATRMLARAEKQKDELRRAERAAKRTPRPAEDAQTIQL